MSCVRVWARAGAAADENNETNSTHIKARAFEMQRHLPTNRRMRRYCAHELKINFAPFLGVGQRVSCADVVRVKHDQAAAGTQNAVGLGQNGRCVGHMTWMQVRCKQVKA